MKLKYFLLASSIILSALSVSTIDIYPDESYNGNFDILKILIPGILFTLFIIYLIGIIKGSVVRYLLIFCLYIISYYSSFISWGMAVPFAGAFSAHFISILLKINHQKFNFDNSFFKYGGLTSLIGLIIFFQIKSNYTFGFGFIPIIILWQLGVGILLIKNTSNRQSKN